MMNDTDPAYCRLCAELKPKNKLIDLQTDDEKRTEIVNKLNRFNVQINFDNNLPKAACYTCVHFLQQTYDFIFAVEIAQDTLNGQIEIKHEDTFTDDEDFTNEELTNWENKIDMQYQVEVVKIEPNTNVTVETITTQDCLEKTKFGKMIVTSHDTLKKQTAKSSKQKEVNSSDLMPVVYLKFSENAEILTSDDLKLSWSDYTWMCHYCEALFPSLKDVQDHSMQQHKICNPYRCIDCKARRTSINNFIIHIRRKHKKYLKYYCYICNYKFSTVKEWPKHMAKHKTFEHVCPGCNTGFISKEEQVKHTSAHYRDRVTRKPAIPIKGDGLTCDICKKTFTCKPSLRYHMVVHTERTMDHMCEICGKCFYAESTLLEHIKIHCNEKRHQCNICNGTFKSLGLLKSHARSHNHDGLKPFSCDKCGKCYRLKQHLKFHIQNVHIDSLSHVCAICNKGFKSKTYLRNHLVMHKEKRHFCKTCQREFTYWPNYNLHMKTKHGIDTSKRKRTPYGTFPLNPTTGEIICEDAELKKKITSSTSLSVPQAQTGKKRRKGKS